MTEYYLEDFSLGQQFESASYPVDEASIKGFAAEFDPQPFHLDEAAAKGTLFQGLAASGWNTAAITMKLMVEGPFKPVGGLIGAGIDELSWPQPVRPGDVLTAVTEVLEKRQSKSRPERGIMKIRTTTYNQRREVVQTYVASMVVQTRPQ
ncbi:MaoC family dehydratase [Oceanobacter mangrovi]|uniref:MaoC family dehydratase n=1 Tax=Oceanobacter mangrovi TaxID=2862510 RepID=UPI001C8E8BA5|nr:MaoC family dehydratase [Oceanobacter mangrovi]